MKCQRCAGESATVHVTELGPNGVAHVHLCKACAPPQLPTTVREANPTPSHQHVPGVAIIELPLPGGATSWWCPDCEPPPELSGS